LRIKQTEDSANDILCGSRGGKKEDRFGDEGEEESADEGPGNGAGEGDVIVGREESGVKGVEGEAVGEDVVGCLDVEGFFDFGVGSEEEVEEY
jgi:hypothetical protein